MKAFVKNFKHASNGFSFIELLVGVAISGLVLAGVFKFYSDSADIADGLSSRSSKQSHLTYLRASVRSAFLKRTQIDLDSGTGQYNGVAFDPAVNPYEFAIIMRSSANPAVFKTATFSVRCDQQKGKLVIPAVPDTFCQPTATNGIPAGRRLDCPQGQRLVISIESDDGSVTTIPASGEKENDGVVAAGFCILQASNDGISLRTAFASRLGNRASWSVDAFDIWEDLGRNGIEFMK